MNDYISRSKLIKTVENLKDCYNGFSDTYDKAFIIGLIEEQPSVERKRGKWIEQDDPWFGWNVWQCSNCKEDYVLEEGTPDDNFYNFCPNCGARMESEGSE